MSMLSVGRISEGFVLDHIQAGKSMEIYKYLNLDKLDCTVAIIKNARSGYQLTHTARVGPALAAKAHSPYGARELRRQVDRAVEQAFADQIASGSVSLGQHWTADCTEDGTIVVQETQTAGVG